MEPTSRGARTVAVYFYVVATENSNVHPQQYDGELIFWATFNGEGFCNNCELSYEGVMFF